MEVTGATKQVELTVRASTMIARFWIGGKVGCHMGDVERIVREDVSHPSLPILAGFPPESRILQEE